MVVSATRTDLATRSLRWSNTLPGESHEPPWKCTAWALPAMRPVARSRYGECLGRRIVGQIRLALMLAASPTDSKQHRQALFPTVQIRSAPDR